MDTLSDDVLIYMIRDLFPFSTAHTLSKTNTRIRTLFLKHASAELIAYNATMWDDDPKLLAQMVEQRHVDPLLQNYRHVSRGAKLVQLMGVRCHLVQVAVDVHRPDVVRYLLGLATVRNTIRTYYVEDHRDRCGISIGKLIYNIAMQHLGMVEFWYGNPERYWHILHAFLDVLYPLRTVDVMRIVKKIYKEHYRMTCVRDGKAYEGLAVRLLHLFLQYPTYEPILLIPARDRAEFPHVDSNPLYKLIDDEKRQLFECLLRYGRLDGERNPPLLSNLFVYAVRRGRYRIARFLLRWSRRVDPTWHDNAALRHMITVKLVSRQGRRKARAFERRLRRHPKVRRLLGKLA